MQSAALVHVTQEIQDNDDLKIMKKQKKKKKNFLSATCHLPLVYTATSPPGPRRVCLIYFKNSAFKKVHFPLSFGQGYKDNPSQFQQLHKSLKCLAV